MDYEAAVLMMDELKRENDDLSAMNASNCAQLKAANAEITMMKNREICYQRDIAKYTEQIALIHKEMNALNVTFYDNDPLGTNNSLRHRSENEIEDNEDCLSKMTKKQLLETIKTERNALKQKNIAMNTMLNEFEKFKMLKTENENLKKDLLSLNEMAQDDLKMQQAQIQKLESENSALCAKNIALNQEKKDLIALLEDKGCDEMNGSNSDSLMFDDDSLHFEIAEYAETNDGELENEINAKNKIINSLTRQMKECEDILSETVQKYLLLQVIDLDLSDEEETDDLEGQNADCGSLEVVTRLKVQIIGLCEQLDLFHHTLNGWRQRQNLKEISIGTYLQKICENGENTKKESSRSSTQSSSSSSWFKNPFYSLTAT